MGIWKSLSGQVQVKLVSADLPKTLEALTQQAIPLSQIAYIDDLTISFWISIQKYHKAQMICKKRGDSFALIQRKGAFWKLNAILKRPVLILGCLLLLGLTIYCPKHVFFFIVDGNETLPDRLILDAAQNCGIRFGVSRKTVRSEKIKNALLEALPELQWAGVNTKGCVAEISVQERREQEKVKTEHRVTKIVAACDAVVTSCTITTGTPMCKVGQVVQKGETLISGYTDCGLSILAGRASGEITGKTSREFTVITPCVRTLRGEELKKTFKLSFVVGKKRINLWDTRGLSYGSCGKITKMYPVCILGGFVLPLRFEMEIYRKYEEGGILTPVTQETAELYASDYLISQMISGRILNREITVQDNMDTIYLSGRFSCEEMIGREQNEELMNIEQNS